MIRPTPQEEVLIRKKYELRSNVVYRIGGSVPVGGVNPNNDGRINVNVGTKVRYFSLNLARRFLSCGHWPEKGVRQRKRPANHVVTTPFGYFANDEHFYSLFEAQRAA
jgi:hypothetical protein